MCIASQPPRALGRSRLGTAGATGTSLSLYLSIGPLSRSPDHPSYALLPLKLPSPCWDNRVSVHFRMTRHLEDNRILYSIGCAKTFVYNEK